MNKSSDRPEGEDYDLSQPLIRLWSSYIPPDTWKAVKDVLESMWINTGKQEKLLRESFCHKFGFRHCVACTSGTAALRASYAALGVGPGDEVISTPYTFIATNTAILEQGATPVFADIQYDTLNIAPASIEERITKRTKAIVCVHYGGYPCDMDEIRTIGRAHSIPIVEDSAHALGSRYKGDYIGVKGDVIAFSLQAIKIITAGDGGLIVTPNADLYSKLKKRVWFGVDREDKPTNILDPLPDSIDVLGFKYNMNDITAAIALSGLMGFDEPYLKRRKIGLRYRQELAHCRKIRLLSYRDDREPNFQIFPIHVANRVEFARHMRARGIMVNVNNRRNDRYKIFGDGIRPLPSTARAEEDVILIPLHAELSPSQVDTIIEAVLEFDRT